MVKFTIDYDLCNIENTVTIVPREILQERQIMFNLWNKGTAVLLRKA